MCASQRSTAVKGGESESAKSRCGQAWCGQKLQFPTRGRGWGNRWWRKGVRRKDACTRMRTHLVSWPGALAGSGGRECAVACGWDPPVSVLACPPSPHTSRLFILHCGKITAPAVSSGPCKVYIACPEVHSSQLPESQRAETNWHISSICKHYWVDLTQLTKDSFSVSLMQRNKFTKTRVCNAFEKY